MRSPLYRLAGRDCCVAAALVIVSLGTLVGCAKSDKDSAAPSSSGAKSQAQEAHSALASAQAANHPPGHGAMPMNDDAGKSPDHSTARGAEPAMGPMDSMPGAGKARVMGQPLASTSGGGLPSTPGAPHLYHVGAQSFFLEQASAIGVTPEQQTKLSSIKDKAELAYSATQGKIAAAESSLWTLTAAEKPDATKIDAKISEIGRLGTQLRMDYIRAVGEAVAVLNAVQHKAIVALNPATPPAAPGSTAPAAGMPMGGAPANGAMPGMGMKDDKMPMPPKAPMAPMPASGGMPSGAAAPGMGHM